MPSGQVESSTALAPWTLPDAFAVRRQEVVSFVGAGGKTTAMFRLAGALAAEGWRVVTTTTTHLSRDESSLAPRHLSSDSPFKVIDELLAGLDAGRHLLVTGPPVEGGSRWGGVPAEWVRRVASLLTVDAVLVEADGARRLPFKAPADHEPVVPPSTTLLVPVVGVDALGRAVQEAAHRPERVCALTGLEPDSPITPQAVAAVLGHPAGGLKGCPPGARVRVLVNKVGTDAELAAAREIAGRVLGADQAGSLPAGASISAVVIGSVGTESPIREVRRRVAAVVLAAGTSSRMETEVPKQLLPWGDSTVIRQVVGTLAGCPLAAIRVVTGHLSDRVRGELVNTPAQVIHNPDYAAGEMLSSLQAGVRSLGDEISACLVVLADQPWLPREVVEALLEAYAAGPAGILAPAFQGRRGHPVLIDRRHWAELLGLGSGLAPRDLLSRHTADTRLVPVGTDVVLRDMDTLDDYHGAVARGRGAD
jgi:molybdenum cofactor cytidylyltransferase